MIKQCQVKNIARLHVDKKHFIGAGENCTEGS